LPLQVPKELMMFIKCDCPRCNSRKFPILQAYSLCHHSGTQLSILLGSITAGQQVEQNCSIFGGGSIRYEFSSNPTRTSTRKPYDLSTADHELSEARGEPTACRIKPEKNCNRRDGGAVVRTHERRPPRKGSGDELMVSQRESGVLSRRRGGGFACGQSTDRQRGTGCNAWTAGRRR
jgi:hypothetical protein